MTCALFTAGDKIDKSGSKLFSVGTEDGDVRFWKATQRPEI